MAEKSEKRQTLERSLAEDPSDVFLRYGLAVQCLHDGDATEGRERLMSLIAENPDGQVAAYQQLGQSFVDSSELDEARKYFRRGIANAAAAGNEHARSEMSGMLAELG